jgi:putative nucleotidyltransferase with HDIG domain
MAAWHSEQTSGAQQADPVTHRNRVAALCAEIAHRLGFCAWERHVIHAAALMLDRDVPRLEEAAVGEVLADLSLPAPGCLEAPSGKALARDVTRILRRILNRQRARVEPTFECLAQILELSERFLSEVEPMEFQRRAVEQTLARLCWKSREQAFEPKLLRALEETVRVRKYHLPELVGRLPVFPKVALEALKLCAKPNANVQDLERLASSDQVLAGRLLAGANSAPLGALQPIATIQHAITYMGLQRTVRVLMRAEVQPLFGSPSHGALWKHSVDSAQQAEELACWSGKVPPEEAYLGGLMHDVGRLLVQRLPGDLPATYSRLCENGCDLYCTEMLLLGYDHGFTGAEVLRHWRYPVHLVRAVEFHHHPWGSEELLGSVLYLTECLQRSQEEGLCDETRVQECCERLGLEPEQLANQPGERQRPAGTA